MDFNFSSHLFWWPFFIFFIILFFLFLKDKVFFRKKKLIRLHKYHQKKPHLTSGGDSGIIYISKLVKPMGVKDEKSYAIPKKDTKNLISQIKYNGLFDVKIIIHPYTKDPSITIKGDKSFVDLVDISLQGETIEIKHQQMSCNYDLDCQIIINTRELTSFHNKGRGQIDIEGISGKKFSYVSSGAENTYLSGNVSNLSINSRSKGDVFAQQLVVKESAYIESNGIGDIFCNSEKDIFVTINHSGNVYLKDITVKLKKKIVGDGEIIYRPFEDSILNFIFIGIQIILFRKIKLH